MAIDASGESRLEMMVNAAGGGHDLGEWLPVPIDEPAPGWKATCRRCGKSVWVGLEGLQYSLLAEQCPGGGDG